ncbi:unnamed protein product [Arctogadus glacialis]
MRLGQGAREDRPGPAWSQATPEGPLITLSTLLLSGPLSPQHYSLAGALAPSDYSIPRPQQRRGPPEPPGAPADRLRGAGGSSLSAAAGALLGFLNVF